MNVDMFAIGSYIKDLNCDLEELKKFSLWCEKNETSSVRSNLSGYQSPSLDVNLEVLKSLIEKLNENVKEYSHTLNLKDNLQLSRLWINVNRFKDSNRLHRHPQSIISGVFYIKTPENCGDLCFEPIDRIEDYWMTSDMVAYNQYNSPNFCLHPIENHCILFPSWLNHLVKPNLNETEERISISFNYNYGRLS